MRELEPATIQDRPLENCYRMLLYFVIRDFDLN